MARSEEELKARLRVLLEWAYKGETPPLVKPERHYDRLLDFLEDFLKNKSVLFIEVLFTRKYDGFRVEVTFHLEGGKRCISVKSDRGRVQYGTIERRMALYIDGFPEFLFKDVISFLAEYVIFLKGYFPIAEVGYPGMAMGNRLLGESDEKVLGMLYFFGVKSVGCKLVRFNKSDELEFIRMVLEGCQCAEPVEITHRFTVSMPTDSLELAASGTVVSGKPAIKQYFESIKNNGDTIEGHVIQAVMPEDCKSTFKTSNDGVSRDMCAAKLRSYPVMAARAVRDIHGYSLRDIVTGKYIGKLPEHQAVLGPHREYLVEVKASGVGWGEELLLGGVHCAYKIYSDVSEVPGDISMTLEDAIDRVPHLKCIREQYLILKSLCPESGGGNRRAKRIERDCTPEKEDDVDAVIRRAKQLEGGMGGAVSTQSVCGALAIDTQSAHGALPVDDTQLAELEDQWEDSDDNSEDPVGGVCFLYRDDITSDSDYGKKVELLEKLNFLVHTNDSFVPPREDPAYEYVPRPPKKMPTPECDFVFVRKCKDALMDVKLWSFHVYASEKSCPIVDFEWAYQSLIHGKRLPMKNFIMWRRKPTRPAPERAPATQDSSILSPGDI